MTGLPYRYRSRGRTPLTAALFAVGIGMTALAVATDARPLMIYAAFAAFVGMIGYLVLRDPKAGVDIDAHAVTFWRGRTRDSVPVAEIERVHVEHWSDSSDVTIHRKDGSKLDIPDRCRPALRPLTQALAAAGVKVTQS